MLLQTLELGEAFSKILTQEERGLDTLNAVGHKPK